MKHFLIIGNVNALTYSYITARLLTHDISTGYYHTKRFSNPEGEIVFGPDCRWYSNLVVPKNKTIVLKAHYSPEKYKTYDNYDAIEVSRIEYIPADYEGEMGVPITVLDNVDKDGLIHFGENAYKIIGGWNDYKVQKKGYILAEPRYIDEQHKRFAGPVMDGSALYYRVIIQKV